MNTQGGAARTTRQAAIPGRGRAGTAVRALGAAALLALGGCATTGATLGSGVGDRLIEHPPFYAGSRAGAAEQVVVLPVAYQRGGSQEAIFDPAEGARTPIAALLAEMNAHLASLDGPGLVGPRTRLEGIAPDVQFGCEQGPLGRCGAEAGDVAVAGAPWMRLAVGRPSARWIDSAREALEGAEAEQVLVITLEVGQHWPRQRNWRGSKEVLLGTGYAVDLPWLTSLDQPVQVLQLTGALVDREGRAVRIGAEGMLAQRTNPLLTGLGVQELISDEDVEQLRTARRDDLPGRPLVWEAALQNLVVQLTGRPGLAVR